MLVKPVDGIGRILAAPCAIGGRHLRRALDIAKPVFRMMEMVRR